MPFVGAIADIPKKWHLCDGSNGTPNLTGRFLEGVTADSSSKIFKAAGLPNIRGYSNIGYQTSGINYGTRQSYAIQETYYSQGYWSEYPDRNVVSYYQFNFDASRCSSVYRNDITTVQPASFTVYYIIKIKK